jgi:GDP-L-fucose synthase
MKKILVTGGHGMIGMALQKVIPEAVFIRSSDYDLRDKKQCDMCFEEHNPTHVIHLAARVGGVKANMDNLADFYTDNIYINTNVLSSCHKYNVAKAVSVLSTCIYPNDVTYPLTEEQIHSGQPHDSNYAYAYAKRMLDVQSRAYRDQYGCNFITVVPNNLYGPHDNFDLNNSHVIPAIIRKAHDAQKCGKNVILWGDGSSLREFTYSKDFANILVFLLEKYDQPEPINIGNTNEYKIKDIADIIVEKMSFGGDIEWDTNFPSGQYRKPSSNKKLIDLGWKKEYYTNIDDGLKETCEWFVETYPNVRGVE